MIAVSVAVRFLSVTPRSSSSRRITNPSSFEVDIFLNFTRSRREDTTALW